MLDEVGHFDRRDIAGDGNDRRFRRLATDALQPLQADCRLGQRQADKRIADMLGQELAGIGRQVDAVEKQVSDVADITEPFRNPFQGLGGNRRTVIFEQAEYFVLVADFGECRRNGTRHMGACCNQHPRCAAAARGEVDEIGIGQDRRAGHCMTGDFRLVLGEQKNDIARRMW